MSKSNQEIERKFLVDCTKWSPQPTFPRYELEQGYLNYDPNRTVRVRVNHTHQVGWLTVKGLTKGDTRPEYEYTIPYSDAIDLLDMCDQKLKKTRYVEFHLGHTWEIDVFETSDFVLAEIELNSSDESFELPDFIGQEVTTNASYFNSNIAKQQNQDLDPEIAERRRQRMKYDDFDE